MKNTLQIFILIISCFSGASAIAQPFIVQGKVIVASTGKALKDAEVFIENTAIITKTNEQGAFELNQIPYQKFVLSVFYEGLESQKIALSPNSPITVVNFEMSMLEKLLDQVVIESSRSNPQGLKRLNAIEESGIYEAKKSEVVILSMLDANMATNNARQVYSKVAGLNIWESDGAGIQLGIGGRGLDPNRTSNFNTRQNGYDISADALGYPESYYTPPVEALEKIEIVRGAASLQYGTQFGGMLNFVMKRGPENKKMELTTRQTVGSWGLFNSFNSLGGKVGGLDYYVYYQRKQGNGWRPNSGFEVDNLFVDFNWQLTDKLFVCLEYTKMDYLAQQAGGLTDQGFEEDPRQSIRSRNWFRVDWNLFANIIEYKFTERTKLNIKNFGLIAGRDALGNLGLITRGDDPNSNRDLISDTYNNYGSEWRLIHSYDLDANVGAFIIGARYYNGNTLKQQGEANNGSGPEFSYLDAEDPSKSNFRFPNRNASAFIESIVPIGSRFTLTPGLRFEHIETNARGSYKTSVSDLAGNVIFRDTIEENRSNNRSFLIAGLGLSYKPNWETEIYANITQNYRAINFNDIRVVNQNITVDENIHDEKGFNADLGLRGDYKHWLNFDFTLFYMRYNDRIGSILVNDPETDRQVRKRTNVADASIVGLETLMEAQLNELFWPQSKHKLSVFSNLSFIHGIYINSQEAAVANKKVELIPNYNFKTGLQYQFKSFSCSAQFTTLGKQYTEATNAISTSDAVSGLIPSYHVADFSASYSYKIFKLESGVNNLTNNRYFTRRAEGYPGPGIIPSDGRSFYVTLQIKTGF